MQTPLSSFSLTCSAFPSNLFICASFLPGNLPVALPVWDSGGWFSLSFLSFIAISPVSLRVLHQLAYRGVFSHSTYIPWGFHLLGPFQQCLSRIILCSTTSWFKKLFFPDLHTLGTLPLGEDTISLAPHGFQHFFLAQIHSLLLLTDLEKHSLPGTP